MVSRRDGNSCLGIRKNGNWKMGIYLRHAVTPMTLTAVALQRMLSATHSLVAHSTGLTAR